MLQVYYFTTSGWGGTGDLPAPTQENTLWGVANVRRCLTLDQAINACEPTETDPVIITPDPTAFFDELGFPLQTVVVNMLSNLRISKNVTLAGGAYRLRLVMGAYYITVSATRVFNAYDVDFVQHTAEDNGALRCYGEATNDGTQISLTRCLVAGHTTAFAQQYSARINLSECAVYGNRNTGYAGPSASNAYRSTIVDTHGRVSSTKTDCVYIKNLTQEQVNAIGFVNPPKVIDPDNPGYYVDETEWTNTDWESVDLRLFSTSSYATGNALTSADGDVYDLAGNKRKIGGAKGAFEVLDDVTHWSMHLPALWFKIDYATDDSPRNVFLLYPDVNPSGVKARAKWETDRITIQAFNESTHSWETETTSTNDSANFKKGNATHYRVYKTSDGATTTNITNVTFSGVPMPGYTPLGQFRYSNGWSSVINLQNNATSAYPNSVFYISGSNEYRDAMDGQASIKKIIVPGWTHVELGNNGGGAQIVVGKGATVRTSGNLTIIGETWKSDELMRRVQLRAPAKLRLKDCSVSD